MEVPGFKTKPEGGVVIQRLALSLAVVLLFGGILESQETAQEPQFPEGFRFESEVQIIPLPVFVTDDDGDPIMDLTLEDFVIKEDGKAREIVVFEPISYDRLSTFKDRVPLHPGLRRSFLLMFDMLYSTPQGILRARKAAMDFVTKRVAPTDLVAVATYTDVGGLKILCNFTTDHMQAENAIETLGLVNSVHSIQDPIGFSFSPLLEIYGEGIGDKPTSYENEFEEIMTDTMRSLKDRMDRSAEDRYSNQSAHYLDTFHHLYSAMNRFSGRKIVLMLSQGIDSDFITGTGLKNVDSDFQKFQSGNVHEIDPDSSFGRTDLRDSLIEGLRVATGADVMINTFDISGLGGEAGAAPGRGRGGGQDTLFLMANETGGRYYSNVNNLEQPLQRILKETSHFYLLGFHPRDLQQKGRFHKIEVKVNRDDVDISARKGWYEPKPADKWTPTERILEVSEYVSKDLLSDDVYFDVLASAYPGQSELVRIPVFLKFPGKQFLEDKRELMQLEIYAYALDSTGRFIDFFSRTLSFDLGKERDRIRRTGIKYYDLLIVRPGMTRLKFIARDVQTGKIGSFIEDVVAPDFTKDFALSPPVFITAEPEWIVARGLDPNRLEPRRKGLPITYPYVSEGNEYIPAVRPEVRKDQRTNIMFRAYNLTLDPETGQPLTEMKFRRIGPDGAEQTIHNIGLLRRPTQPEPNCFELLFQINWEEVPLGPGAFELAFTDVLAQKTLKVSSAYVLTP